MENPELNELCQKILGKSLDEVFDEFEKRPRKVMSFTLEATPSGFIVSTDVSKAALDNPVYGTRVQEAFDKINAYFREESISIANVGNKVSGFKFYTNMKEKP